MLNFSNKSKSGKKARDPGWWGDLFEYYYPDISLGIIDKLATTNPAVAKFIRGLPSKCPFERQLWLGDILVLHVPALCKFNPLFRQLMRIKVRLLQEDDLKKTTF